MTDLLKSEDPIPTPEDLAPRILPPKWRSSRRLPSKVHALVWEHRDGWTVIMSVDVYKDGVWWHVSVAHPRKIPPWSFVVEVKELFMGPETSAMHLVPPRSKWLNVHPKCLHLWVRLDAPTYPPSILDG